MSSDPTVQIEKQAASDAASTPSLQVAAKADPAAVEKGERDLFLPTLFLSGAALILAWLDPLYISFQPRLTETLAAVAIELVVVWIGALWRKMPVMYVGVGLVLATVVFQSATQPSPLTVPIVAVWPLRMLLVGLVAI